MPNVILEADPILEITVVQEAAFEIVIETPGPQGPMGPVSTVPGPQGIQGPAGLVRNMVEKSTTSNIVAGTTFVRAKVAGIVLTLPTADANFSCTFKNVSNGTITIQASGSDVIDGDTSIPLLKGQARLLGGYNGGFDVC